MNPNSIFRALLAAAILLAPLSAKGSKGSKGGEGAATGAKVVMGVIAEIDAKAGTLVIDGKTYKVDEKTSILATGKKEGATLADFKKDDKVTLSFSEVGGEQLISALSHQSGDKGKKKKAK